MKFNNKRLAKTSQIVNSTIAVVLCGFLILLSSKFIDDIDNWKESPSLKSFENTPLLNEKESEIQKIEKDIFPVQEKNNSVVKAMRMAKKNYSNAKRSFDNWLEARKTVGSPNEDKEVLQRAKELDKYFQTQQDWELELSVIQDSLRGLNSKIDDQWKLIDIEMTRARQEQIRAIHTYNVHIFLIRLMIILPILLLGVFFIIKFRKHKYWPLFLGFVLFSFYAFFFGLVPYLPSYGGYIRYTVGTVLIILFGIYAINRIRSFVEQKKKELRVSTEERAKHVKTETAEKALDNHMCPSCGKDFIIKDWDKSLDQNDKTTLFGKVTDFCRFCGLELFKKCKSCGTENYAHLPFCCSCGDKTSNDEHESQ